MPRHKGQPWHKEKKRASQKAYRKAHSEKIKAYQKAYEDAHKEEIKARRKAYREANKIRISAGARAYNKANSERLNAQATAWQKANPEKVAKIKKAYRKANPEKVKAYNKAYWKANSDKNRQRSHKHRALKHATQIEPISEKQVYLRDGWKCQICHKRVNKKLKWPHPMCASLDHIIPLSKGGTHTYANVQLAHFGCNMSKHNNVLPQGEQMRCF